jgi:hypothetical protein
MVLLTTKTQLRYRATQRGQGMYSVSEGKIYYKPFVPFVFTCFSLSFKDALAFFLSSSFLCNKRWTWFSAKQYL